MGVASTYLSSDESLLEGNESLLILSCTSSSASLKNDITFNGIENGPTATGRIRSF